MLTLAERGRMGNEALTAARVTKQRELDRLLSSGMNLKRAAAVVGWSYRSARRWRKRA